MVTQPHPGNPVLSTPSHSSSEFTADPQLKSMKVLLVANYEFDGSMSMKLWANAMLRELLQLGVDVRMIAPRAVLGRMKPSASGFGKWLGYCDRFLLFPRALQAAASRADVVHICDQGGAMYALRIKGTPVVVTCHDMLAVRGALGELPEMKPSPFGRFLQRWICRGMQAAGLIVCVSRFTFDDVCRILNRDRNLRLVLNALTYPFQQIPAGEVDLRLANLREIDRPFILHVGSSHSRKNRDGVLRVFARAAQEMDLKMVFAGEPLNPDQLQLASHLRVDNRVVQLLTPDVSTIEALYNRAVALLFPSRCEGFGAPPIEAQACGCPVVGSSIPALVEVLGQSALLHSLEDEEGMASSLRRLALDCALRDDIRRRGLENVRSRFQFARMTEQYVSVYREFACQSSR